MFREKEIKYPIKTYLVILKQLKKTVEEQDNSIGFYTENGLATEIKNQIVVLEGVLHES